MKKIVVLFLVVGLIALISGKSLAEAAGISVVIVLSAGLLYFLLLRGRKCPRCGYTPMLETILPPEEGDSSFLVRLRYECPCGHRISLAQDEL
jgi:hypothetical protein